MKMTNDRSSLYHSQRIPCVQIYSHGSVRKNANICGKISACKTIFARQLTFSRARKMLGKSNAVVALPKQDERAVVTLISGYGTEATKVRQVGGIEPGSS